MKGRSEGSETERKRRKRLESLTREEWDEAARRFWRWFEKVRSWEEAKGPEEQRLSRN
jgi:hypothetical protein